jgi:hypothetical protein
MRYSLSASVRRFRYGGWKGYHTKPVAAFLQRRLIIEIETVKRLSDCCQSLACTASLESLSALVRRELWFKLRLVASSNFMQLVADTVQS